MKFFNLQWPPALMIGWLITMGPARADDWPQWMGPQRDGIWRESGIVEKFPDGGPALRWRAPIAAGYSGPAVAQGKVALMDRPAGEAEKERVLCLNEADGKTLWQQEYDCPYKISYPAGPRVTPNIEGQYVYTLGAMGDLFCWDLETGREIWSRHFKKDYGAVIPMWGCAAHPLIDGEKLICLVGGEAGAVMAFDKRTGKEIWRALDTKRIGYCPPVIYEAGGRRQLIIWHSEAINSLDPANGRVFWRVPFDVKADLSVATPRKRGDLFCVSAFYNGTVMLKLDAQEPRVTELWRGKSGSEMETDGLHSLITTPYMEDGYLYGACAYGQFRCLKASNGERVWESFVPTGGQKTRWGTVFIVKNGDRFFLFNEKGDLLIARLSPRGYEEISRAHLLEPANRDPGRWVVWSHPAFAHRRIYARNDKEIACFSLAE